MSANNGDSKRGWWWEANDLRKKSGLTCSFVIFAALNVTMMFYGIQGLHHCPVQPMIPIYLVVAGSTSLSLLLVRLIVSHIFLPSLEQRSLLETSSSSESGGKTPKHPAVEIIVMALGIYDSLASIFSTCWLIVGSIYVYGAKPTHSQPDAVSYCDYTAYMFAFVVITIGYVSLGLSLLVAMLHCCCRRDS